MDSLLVQHISQEDECLKVCHHFVTKKLYSFASLTTGWILSKGIHKHVCMRVLNVIWVSVCFMSTGKVYLKWDIGFQGLDIYLSICMLYVDWESLSQKGLKALGLGYLSIFVLLCRLGKFFSSENWSKRKIFFCLVGYLYDFMSGGKTNLYFSMFNVILQKFYSEWNKNLIPIPIGKESLVGYSKILFFRQVGFKIISMFMDRCHHFAMTCFMTCESKTPFSKIDYLLFNQNGSQN